jgi:hypothetical protein
VAGPAHGYWSYSATGRPIFPKPGGDVPGTPLFDQLWSASMGRHHDEDGDGQADQGRHAAPEGYVYTDPVDDDAYPRITTADPDDMPDAFPENWGAAPTERDQAAIDAGNA